MIGVNTMISADRNAYWSPLQAIAWIVTRDYGAVECCGKTGSSNYVSLIAWLELNGNHKKSQRSAKGRNATDDGKIARRIFTATDELHGALMRGDQRTIGKRRKGARRARMEPRDWADQNINFHRTDFLSPSITGEWWHDILLPSETVIDQWPQNRDDTKPSKSGRKLVDRSELRRTLTEFYDGAKSRGETTSVDQDEKHIREKFPGMGALRDKVRALRKELAPSGWQRQGRRTKN